MYWLIFKKGDEGNNIYGQNPLKNDFSHSKNENLIQTITMRNIQTNTTLKAVAKIILKTKTEKYFWRVVRSKRENIYV